jgi:hypothetical protein
MEKSKTCRPDCGTPNKRSSYELTHALPKELASSLSSIQEIEAELQNELQNNIDEY